MTRAAAPRTTAVALVLVAWTLVALPLGWGLYQSVVKSRPLFAAPTLGNAPSQSAH